MRKMSMIIFLVALFSLTACAGKVPPPNAQLATATSAVSQAESAGAYESAPVELRDARQKLEQARQAMNRKDNLAAKRLAEQATVDANLAESKARTVKSQKALQEVRDSIRILQEEIDRKSDR